MKKFCYTFLILTLVLSMLISPASMLTAFAADDEITSEWVLKGDVNLDGTVKIDDARKALRVAANIDEMFAKSSKEYKAADADSDSLITILDARLILLHAIGTRNIVDKEFQLLLDTANNVKLNAFDASKRTPFKKVNTSRIVDASYKKNINGIDKITLAIPLGLLTSTLDDELKKMRNQPDEVSSGSVTIPDAFIWQFPVERKDWAMKLDPEALSSFSYVEDEGSNQIQILAKLKTESFSEFPEDPTTTNHGSVFFIGDASISNSFAGMNTEFSSVKFTYSDSYVKYTIDKTTLKPIYAEYYYKWTTVITMTLTSRSDITITIITDNVSTFDFVNVF